MIDQLFGGTASRFKQTDDPSVGIPAGQDPAGRTIDARGKLLKQGARKGIKIFEPFADFIANLARIREEHKSED